MRSRSRGRRRSVDKGTCGPGIHPTQPSGCRPVSGGTYGTHEEVPPGAASRENAAAGVRSACDRPTAVAWRREAETFNFLGFTHICVKKRSNGRFTVLRQTIRKRLQTKLNEVKAELRRRMHEPIPKQGK